jgi:hypothetical protein
VPSVSLGDGLRATRLKLWDGVCSIYDFDVETPAGSGSVVMAEWNVVRDGRIASARLVFDTAAFAALMPSS